MSQVMALDQQRFDQAGYLVVRQLCPRSLVERMATVVRDALTPTVLAPVEYEADVGYLGAPAARDASGGDTPRRLLHALSRDSSFRQWALGPLVQEQLRVLNDGADMRLSQSHHNCVMTKYPGFSSRTSWHQDIRYWSFDRPELISIWLALSEENASNGALSVIPGSHRVELDRGRFDGALFLRPELEQNRALIDSAVPLTLEAGDALFFHCRLFHAAGRNQTDKLKISSVFTYHDVNNHPIPNTRSALYPSIAPGVQGVQQR